MGWCEQLSHDSGYYQAGNRELCGYPDPVFWKSGNYLTARNANGRYDFESIQYEEIV